MNILKMNKTLFAFSIVGLVYWVAMLFFNMIRITDTIFYSFVLELFTLPALILTAGVLMCWVYNLLKGKTSEGFTKLIVLNVLLIAVCIITVLAF